MRWGNLLSTLLLAGGSTLLPRLAFQSMGMDSGGLMGALGSIESLQSGGAVDARVEKQLEALKSGQIEGVPLEQLAAIQDLARRSQTLEKKADMAQAVMGALQNQKPLGQEMRGGVLRDSEAVRRAYRNLRPRILAFILWAGLATLAVLVLGLVPLTRGLVRFYLTFVFALAGKWLMLVSTASVGYFAVSKLNPWPLMPQEIVYAPVGFMLLSGLFIRILDPNYPLWNQLLKGLGAPILACLAVVGLRLGPGLLNAG